MILVPGTNSINATTGSVLAELPSNQPPGTDIVIVKTDSTDNAVTVVGAIGGQASSATISFQGHQLEFKCDAYGGWYPVGSNPAVPQVGVVPDSNATITPLFSFNQVTSAPFQFVEWSSGPQVDATYDHCYSFGLNAARHATDGGASGVPVAAGKPAWYMGFEDNWHDPVSNTNGPEWYVAYWSGDGTSTKLFRPFYTRVVQSNVNGAHHAVTYLDIGGDGAGAFTVTTSGFSGVLFTVTPTQIRAVVDLSLQSAAPQLFFNVNGNGVGWILQAPSTTQLNLLNSAGTPRAIFLDGGSALAAQVEFQSSAKIDGRLVIGTGALATTATDGFLHVPTCAGPPTGVPIFGAAVVYDTTSNKMWVYNGTWKAAAFV